MTTDHGATKAHRDNPIISTALSALAPMFALAPVTDGDTTADTATGIWIETIVTDGTQAAVHVLDHGDPLVRTDAHRAVLNAVHATLRAHGMNAGRTPAGSSVIITG